MGLTTITLNYFCIIYTQVVTGPKYTLKFLNLQDTPHLYFDTVNQLLVYNSFDISEVDVSSELILLWHHHYRLLTFWAIIIICVIVEFCLYTHMAQFRL